MSSFCCCRLMEVLVCRSRRLLFVGDVGKIGLGRLVGRAGHWLMTVLRETVFFKSQCILLKEVVAGGSVGAAVVRATAPVDISSEILLVWIGIVF